MNNEEERKAFDTAFNKKYPAIAADAEGRDLSAIEIIEYAWGGWFLAKEMAKPGCILDKLDGLYRIRFNWHPQGFMKFHSEEEARAWVKHNGYRVIE